MTFYKVSAGTQVHHDGVTYGEGSTIDAGFADARLWLSAGWVTEVQPTAKRLPAKAIEDKAVKTGR